MAKELRQKLGSMEYDGLITGLNPPVRVDGGTIAKLEARLEKLNNTGRKDSSVTFEQLGVDRLFIDEAHSYKNCAKRCATSRC